MKVNGEALSGTTATWSQRTNTLEITVTYGSTSRVYTVTVTKRDATLSALSLGAAALDQEFDPDTTEYTAATSNATNTVTATPATTGATVALTLNDEPMTGTSASWDSGVNTLVITVTDGDATEEYTVTVTYTPAG